MLDYTTFRGFLNKQLSWLLVDILFTPQSSHNMLLPGDSPCSVIHWRRIVKSFMELHAELLLAVLLSPFKLFLLLLKQHSPI